MKQLSDLQHPEPVTTPPVELREGKLARSIEQQTAKLPSDVWLWSAFGAMGLSLLCRASKRDKEAQFVANWVPTLLILGVYNKLVKLHGSDGS